MTFGADATEMQPTVRVQLDPCVDFIERQVGGQSSWLARQSGTGKYFELGHDEYAVLALLRQGHDLGELASNLVNHGVTWTPADLAKFIAMLVKERLATVDDRARQIPIDTAPPVAMGRSAWPAVLSLLSMSLSQRFPLFHADSITKRLNRVFGWCFGGYGVLLWCIVVFSGLVISWTQHVELMGEMRRLFDPSLWLVLAILWCVSKLIHEFGHAVAAKRQGVRVGNMGIMFFLFAPLAYVDVTDAWRLPGRWARARIAMSGVYAELAVASISVWGYFTLPDGVLKHLCAQMFMVAGPTTLLVNANPLLRLDGYYVLSDLADIPNLRLHGRQQLVQWIERILFGFPRSSSMLGGWRRSVATLHALASVLFQVVWMSGLVFAIASWAKGLGLVLAVVAVTLWCVLPLSRWIWKVWTFTPSIGQRRRMISYLILASSLGQYFAAAPSPIGRRVPVVVRYSGEQVARASANAFVEAVHVRHAQTVEPGDILVVLDEPELRQRRDAMADDFEAAQLHAVQLRRQGEIALAAAESQRAESLRRQLDELTEQVSGLTIIAARAGIVLNPNLDELHGHFLRSGDEILRVADPRQMELLISVSESDAAAFEKACTVGDKIPVRLRGGHWIGALPEPLLPRASETLAHPALASTVGGPLAVEPAGTSRDSSDQRTMRTITPRLESITRLDPITSNEVRCGQIGSMSISDNRPLLTRVIEALTPSTGG